MTVERYLLEELPAALTPVEGRVVQFTMIDGDLSVYYDFEGGSVKVHSGVADRVDLTVALTEEALSALANDTLDVGRALNRRHLQLYGDTTLLARMTQA